jgi:hypothetical protein
VVVRYWRWRLCWSNTPSDGLRPCADFSHRHRVKDEALQESAKPVEKKGLSGTVAVTAKY